MSDMSNVPGARPPGRLLSMHEVVEQTSLSRPTIYRRIASGTFPRSRPTGGRRVVWSERDVEDWKSAVFEAPET